MIFGGNFSRPLSQGATQISEPQASLSGLSLIYAMSRLCLRDNYASRYHEHAQMAWHESQQTKSVSRIGPVTPAAYHALIYAMSRMCLSDNYSAPYHELAQTAWHGFQQSESNGMIRPVTPAAFDNLVDAMSSFPSSPSAPTASSEVSESPHQEQRANNSTNANHSEAAEYPTPQSDVRPSETTEPTIGSKKDGVKEPSSDLVSPRVLPRPSRRSIKAISHRRRRDLCRKTALQERYHLLAMSNRWAPLRPLQLQRDLEPWIESGPRIDLEVDFEMSDSTASGQENRELEPWIELEEDFKMTDSTGQ